MRRVKKSRNGCARCKSKRVKCGEEKPSCARCIRLGVKCPGYTQSLRWVNKCETLDNNAQEEPAVIDKRSPSELSSLSLSTKSGMKEAAPNMSRGEVLDLRAASHTPKQRSLTANSIDSMLQTSLFCEWDPSAGSEAPLVVDDASGLCGELWDLQGDSSLRSLADICAPPPVSMPGSAPGSHRGSFDLGSTAGDVDIPVFSTEMAKVQFGCSALQDFSPAAIVRNYPPHSPRPSNINFMSISRPLNNPSWTLIEYYFKEVAALFSSYDSQMNPFRSTVSRLWGSSLAMCRTMQSMAAATLVNDFPQFGPLGLKMREEAAEIISKEAVMDDKSLLAVLMLGMTASWHVPSDLGVSFFNLLRQNIRVIPAKAGPLVRGSGNDYRFFEEALIYWEMLLSFVADDDAVALSGLTASGIDESIVLQRVPHPWTGIAREAQYTVQEVGRLIRRERKRVRAAKFTSQDSIAQAQISMERGRELEETLLNLAHPSEAEIVSPGDDDTPVWHLLTIAEIYRCAGLMQLYRVFPDLLRARLPLDNTSELGGPGTAASENEFSEIFSGFHSSAQEPLDRSDISAATTHDDWLTEFSMTTLSRLKTIPQESRTRCLQPFLLVAMSSELRLPRVDVINSVDIGVDNAGVSLQAIEVSQHRKFIVGRLMSFTQILPPKPIEVCVKLVREVWRRMDEGEEGVYWLDIMIEKGWETTMG